MHVYQQHFHVNCLGQVRVVKAFLPLIKRSIKGRIVNMASMGARMFMPMFTAYDMSKAGVEIFSDVLRLEMIKWGVKVSIIAPSGFDTNMTKFGAGNQWKHMDAIKESLTESQRAYFTDTYFKKVMGASTMATKSKYNEVVKEDMFPSDISPIYHAIEHALLSQTPKARYPVGTGARFGAAVTTHFPNWVTDFLLTATSLTNFGKGFEPAANMKFE